MADEEPNDDRDGDPSAVAGWISLAIALISLLVSFLAWWNDRPEARQEREKQVKMRIVATRSIVFYERYINTSNNDDESFKKAMQSDARELEKAVYEAVSCGLWTTLVGTGKNAPALFVELVTTLTWVYSTKLDKPLTLYDEHKNLMNGITRLVDQCYKYETTIRPQSSSAAGGTSLAIALATTLKKMQNPNSSAAPAP